MDDEQPADRQKPADPEMEMYHRHRADQHADAFRKMLLTANFGGIGLLFAVAGVLVERIGPLWAIPPAIIFAFSSWMVGSTLLFQKNKELRRRNAAKDGKKEPNFTSKTKRAETRDRNAAMVTIGGTVASFVFLSGAYLLCR